MMQQGDPLAQAGRATDTMMAHLTPGEVVIPVEFLADPDFAQFLQAAFKINGVDMAEFTVGDPANKINPETGYPEFFGFKKFFKKIAPFAGLAAMFVPGLQGLGAALGGSILGAGAAGASTLGSALIGGGFGALGGGLKGGLQGAALAGLGANIGSLGSAPLASGVQGATSPGSGILGAIGNATGLNSGNVPSIGGLIGGSTGGGSSFNSLGALSNVASGLANDSAIKKAQKEQELANQQQLQNLETFDASGLTEDPGYQFNLAQGQQGLNRSLGAQGGLFSGRALKAAAEYNQNYADNAFKDAYGRWANKTGAQNQIIGGTGANNAGYGIMRSNNVANSISNIFNQNQNKPWWMQSYA
jgi:hypothetical protein